MRLWIKHHRLNLLGALLVGLVVAYIISLYCSSIPVFADQKTEIVSSASLKSSSFTNDDAYWKGRIDERLDNLIQGQNKVNKKLEELECSVTDIKIGAAKQGGIYGGIASIIILISSLVGKGLFKSIWRKNGKEVT